MERGRFFEKTDGSPPEQTGRRFWAGGRGGVYPPGLVCGHPQFGPFGLLWTAVALIITILNGVNAFSERGVPSGVIHIEDEADGLAPPPAAVPPQPSSPAKSPEERLETLRGLHQQGLITAEEYDRRRREILDEI